MGIPWFWTTKLVAPSLTVSLLGLLLPGAAGAICPAQLGPQLETALNQAPLDGAYTGLVVQTLAPSPQNRRTLFARHGDRLFVPASSLKLLTTAAALQRLGADYRIRTSLYGSAHTGGLMALRVVGRGDPTLTTNHIEGLAQQVVQSGVTQVSRLVAEDAYFPGWATNPTWEWEDTQFAFAAPVNSLILNQNAVTVQVTPTQVGQPLRVAGLEQLPAGPLPMINDGLTVAAGASPVPLAWGRAGDPLTLRLTGQMPQNAAASTYNLAVLNPAQQFAAALGLALARQGVVVGPAAIAPIPAPALGPELAALESPPLSELLIPTNRDSNNLYAEVLLKTLGITVAGPSTPEASQAGAAAVKAVLAELGVNTEPLRLADGSGLSRHNLVTPWALVETLQAMAWHPQAPVFKQSLAVAGVSGTLRHRLRNTPLAGRLQGKSGALTGNVVLAGYLQPPNYDPLVFSILINHANQHANILRGKIDEILLLIAQLSDRC